MVYRDETCVPDGEAPVLQYQVESEQSQVDNSVPSKFPSAQQYSSYIKSLATTEVKFKEPTIGLVELVAQSPEVLLCGQDLDGDNELTIALIKQEDKYAILIIDTLKKRKSQKLLNLQNELGQTALHLAVKQDLVVVVQSLVNAGVDVTIRDQAGNTPLHSACIQGLAEHVTILTKTNGKENASLRNYKGWNCIHLAVQHGHVGIVEQLVRIGVDINDRGGGRGMTALHLAIQASMVSVVLFLLHSTKVDLNVTTYDGYTPVQMAAGYKNNILVAVLLKSKVYINNCEMFEKTQESTDYDSD